MFNFMCKTLPHLRSFTRTLRTHELLYVQYHPLSSSTLKSVTDSSNEDSFRVSYLINACGFPPEKALSASNYVKFETPDKPDSVLAFFKKHGFTNTQISILVRRYPPILLSDPEKTILPKLDFFTSIGLSRTDLTKLIAGSPTLLKSSLEKRIIPSFNLFKSLLPSNDRTIRAIKRFAMVLGRDLEARMIPNIKILREIGVPESNIVVLLTYQPRVFMTNTDRFEKIVEEVKQMGFNPLRMKYVLAIHALKAMSKPVWEKKFEVYKKWGWSEDDIFVAFEKHPWCMMTSEDKISAVMDFLINKMGFASSDIARRPSVFSLSLEKRIVPRCLVYQVLLEKGLMTKDYSLNRLLETPDYQFLRKITNKYKEAAPELLKLYKEKLELSK